MFVRSYSFHVSHQYNLHVIKFVTLEPAARDYHAYIIIPSISLIHFPYHSDITNAAKNTNMVHQGSMLWI